MINEFLDRYEKKELIELIELYSKNWLAMDGLWFQSVEKKFGMKEAMEHNCSVWGDFTKIEAEKIKSFLGLKENSGLDGLKQAIQLRLYSNINKDEITIDKNTLTYRVVDCRVQTARKRKGMEYHPCKAVGIIEYSLFAKAVDERFDCECVSCYPDITDETCACAWKFTLSED